MRAALPLSMLLSGCSDFNLFGHGKDPGAGGHPSGDTAAGACAAFEAPGARTETAPPTCPPDGDGGGSGDPWSAPIWWQASSIPTDPDATQSVVTPIAVQLDDDDALEVITVVTHGFSNDDVGWAAAFDGAAGAFEWAWYGACPQAALLAADVDGDGGNDVLVEDSDGHLVALRGDGTELWRSAAVEPVLGESVPLNVGDLDDDGAVDILYGRWVLDGATGATKVEGDPALDNNGAQLHSAAIADVDLDGTQEVFLDGTAFDGSLDEKWSLVEPPDLYNDYMWPVIVQADDDDPGEVGFLFGDRWVLADSDGATLARVDYHGDLQVEPGPPCAADFDGDGVSEIAWPSNGALTMMELDGTADWTASISDESSAAGCVGFDFDADGAVDIAYGDEVSMAIYSGRTGERMWEAAAPHRSWTHVETPAVADVNADGHADLLFVDNDGYLSREDGWGTPPFLTMVSADPGRWPPAGTWPLQEYAMTNVLADGSVPADPDPSWLANNTWRALPSPVTSGSADLAIEVAGTCVLDCGGGRLEASFQVGNVGSVDAPAGALATLTVDGSEDVQTVVLPAIAAGTWLPGQIVELAFDPTLPPTVRASVSSGGMVEDCEDANDEATFNGPACAD